MQPTTTGRSPLASLALRIGETVTIRTTDGFLASVRLVDVRMNYGAIQAQVVQDGRPGSSLQWVDATAKRLI